MKNICGNMVSNSVSKKGLISEYLQLQVLDFRPQITYQHDPRGKYDEMCPMKTIKLSWPTKL